VTSTADTTASPTVTTTDPKAIILVIIPMVKLIIVKGTASDNANGSGVANVELKTHPGEFYALTAPKAQGD
jgi:hypothetical protein